MLTASRGSLLWHAPGESANPRLCVPIDGTENASTLGAMSATSMMLPGSSRRLPVLVRCGRKFRIKDRWTSSEWR